MSPQILRGEHGLLATGNRAGLGLWRPLERSLRPSPLLHSDPAEPSVLQGVLLDVRVRAGIHRAVDVAAAPIAATATAADFRGAALEPVGRRDADVATNDSREPSGPQLRHSAGPRRHSRANLGNQLRPSSLDPRAEDHLPDRWSRSLPDRLEPGVR